MVTITRIIAQELEPLFRPRLVKYPIDLRAGLRPIFYPIFMRLITIYF